MPDIRDQLIDVFKDTQKYYTENPVLSAAVDHGRKYTCLYESDDYPDLPENDPVKHTQEIRVTRDKTFEAAMKLHEEFPDKKIAVLNFASTTRPGGGVKSGSRAQEESLCRCSTLYPTIDRRWLWNRYYDVNRTAKDVRHSDACIYSPGVIICKTDDPIPKRLDPKDFVTVDVISCAAPNLRREPANHHNPETGKPMRMDANELFELHLSRAEHILHIAAYNNISMGSHSPVDNH